MSIQSRKLLRRARWLLWVDGALSVFRAPVRLGIFLIQLGYLILCALSWGVILWVLGEKHVGVLKLLLMLMSLGVWAFLLTLLYSIWTVQAI